MPNSYSRLQLIIWLLIFCCSAPLARAQRPASAMVYDSLGRPIRKNHELIVMFDPTAINRAAVSSRNGDEGPLSRFLKPAAAASIQANLGFDLPGIYAIKSIPFSVPADSVIIDNTGQAIPNYPWWSSFLLVLPPGTDDYAVQYLLRQQPFTVVKSVGMNWAVFPASSVSSASSQAPFLQSSGTSILFAYPQPAQGTLTFALPSPLPATAELTILTQAGQVLRTETHRVYEHSELTPLQVDLSTLPAGQYFYRLITLKNTYRGRFEKQ